MENRARLRVQKKKPTKRSGRKPLQKKLLDYLKSDTFLYAPLVSPLPSDFPSPDTFASSAKVVKLKKPIKESQWFREYLESDVYMYGPLLHLPHSPQEPLKDCGTVMMNVSTRRSIMKVNQQTNHLGNANQRPESHFPQTYLSDHLTVKHTMYRSCRSTSASRNVTPQLTAESL